MSRLTAEQIEAEQIAQVLRVDSGDLEAWKRPDGTNAFGYSYDFAPEWLDKEVQDQHGFYSEFRTGITFGGGFYSGDVPETIPADDGTWKLIGTYTHNAETECPFASWDPELNTDRADKTIKTADCVGPDETRCPYCEGAIGEDHGFIYIGEGVEAIYVLTVTWRVFTLDVWGNETDGFEVNDRFAAGSISVPSGAGDEAIWSALVEAGIASGPFERASFDSPGDTWIGIEDAETGKPVFHLEREET